MNKEDLFLKNLYSLLNAGYSIEESLILCRDILHDSFVDEFIEQLQHGYSVEDILMKSHLSPLFKEYFRFYQNKNCLSDAIEKSLEVCLSKQKYQNKLKSQLTYPLILLTFLFLFSLFVVFILLPQVEQLFISFQIQKSFIIQSLFYFFYMMPLFIVVVGMGLIIFITRLLLALKRKSFQIIEWYLRLPLFRVFLQKYFSLKFAVYYQELLDENMDSASIIQLLNDLMNDVDLKIVLYEMNNRLKQGEALEDILHDFEYLDPLFLRFFEMSIKNPSQNQSLSQYIQLTYELIDLWIAQLLKYLVPSIYAFVAIFVITIYVSIIIPMMNVISNI